MHHKYGGTSESHACKNCVWPIILDAELYIALYKFPGERVLIVVTHQVQCKVPTFEAVLRKICTCFSKDAEGLITEANGSCLDAVKLFVFFLIL